MQCNTVHPNVHYVPNSQLSFTQIWLNVLLLCCTIALLNNQKLCLKLWVILTLIRMPVSHNHIASNHNMPLPLCSYCWPRLTCTSWDKFKLSSDAKKKKKKTQPVMTLSIYCVLLSKPSHQAGWSWSIKVGLLTLTDLAFTSDAKAQKSGTHAYHTEEETRNCSYTVQVWA